MTDYPNEPYDGYSEAEEYQDNFLDDQRELWEEQTGGNYPAARKPESLFGLFKSVWRTHDSTKVANLNDKEIGDLGISVRDCQNIASFAGFLGHKGVKGYFNRVGEITLATSMSKKGWFPELFVTSKKFAHKGNINNLKQPQKWRIFGSNQPSEQQEE